MIKLNEQAYEDICRATHDLALDIVSGKRTIPKDSSFKPGYIDQKEGDIFLADLPEDTLAEKIYIYSRWLLYQGVIFVVSNTIKSIPPGNQDDIENLLKRLEKFKTIDGEIKSDSKEYKLRELLTEKIEALGDIISGDLKKYIPVDNIPKPDDNYMFDIRKGKKIIAHRVSD